jgi:hypothetical protein
MSADDEFAVVSESTEQFMEQSRLRSLFDARDKAAQAIRDATMREQELRRKTPRATLLVDEHVRAAVTAYVLECEPLYQNTELGQEYWVEYRFEPVTLAIAPPDEVTTSGRGYKSREILGLPEGVLEENRVLSVTGIQEYLALPSPITVRWTGTQDGPLSSGRSTVTATTELGAPRILSESVFRATNQLLADLDIGIDAERQSGGEAQFDYSDLL